MEKLSIFIGVYTHELSSQLPNLNLHSPFIPSPDTFFLTKFTKIWLITISPHFDFSNVNLLLQSIFQTQILNPESIIPDPQSWYQEPIANS